MEGERSVAYVGRSDEMGVYRGFSFILGQIRFKFIYAGKDAGKV